jgi:conjugative relaxase-like TrwC/TraI family protein
VLGGGWLTRSRDTGSVLSIGKIAAGPAAAAYYTDQVAPDRIGYYAGEGEAVGQWLGAGAAALGLRGEVTREQLEAVLAGAGHREVREGAVAGFDLTFRAPKSVSVLWAVSDEDVSGQLRAGHDAAVQQAVGYLEREACRARRGAGGAVQVPGDGFVSAAFVHRTSRAGDPLLHTHVVTANLTCGPDGRWTALDGRHLYAQARTAGFVYQAALREQLTERLGLSWQPVEQGVADVAGVPRDVVEEFSQRRRQILQRVAERGERSAAAAQVAALDTREAKDDVPLAQRRREWRARAAEHGLDRTTVERLRGRSARRPVAGVQPGALTERSTTFTRADVVRALAEAAPDGASVTALEARADELLRQGEAVHVGEDGLRHARYSTPDLLAAEQRLINQVADCRAAYVPQPTEDEVEQALAVRATIGDDQAQVARRLCLDPAGIAVVRAPAGTGKTFALDAAREAWEAAGVDVVGCALSARAALELEDQAGIRSTTIARLLNRLDQSYALPEGGVLVVDEAGMVGTRALDRLADACEERAVKLILVGDDRQLPEIDAGGAFRAMADAAPVLELRESRRQREPWDRAALDALRRGDVERWACAYRDAGRITIASTCEDARAALVNDWARADGDAVMVAHRRADVADLNARARQLLQAEGRLAADQLERSDGRCFAEGDRVIATRNDRATALVNGRRAMIDAIDGATLRLRDDGGTTLQVGADDVDHAYAITAHRTQGATVDRAFVLGSENLYREWGYTALSRHRDEARFYVARGDLDLDADLPPGRDPLIAGLTRLLGRSAGQQTAGEHLRELTDEQVRREQQRLAERLRLDELPLPTDDPLKRLPHAAEDRERCEERLQRVIEERSATRLWQRAARRDLDRAIRRNEEERSRLDTALPKRTAPDGDATERWLERHGPDARRLLALATEASTREQHRWNAERRLDALDRTLRLEPPAPAPADALDLGW